ncbi:MAG TPA: PQQ-binding-like beta-propeller repeat protein [Amycolatopsis sp.]|nr:PQQ-binding-like beta-propeller repeat protein [Amycolatopsis sp.]
MLAGGVPPSSGPPRHTVVRRERRSPWNRPRDRVIAAVLAVVVVTAGLLVWAGSESHATVSETAAPGPGLPVEPPAVPATLTELWQAPNGAEPVPVAAGAAVVTGSGGEVLGRDPLTGQVRWQYSRDLRLCTVGEAWSRAVALFRKDGVAGESGCSEVVALDADTGHRKAQRTGSAPLGTQLVTDNAYVTAFGPTLLNTWRDDLVETVEYGKVPALVNPDKQPRVGCTYGSVAASSSRVAVIERCPGDPGDRLTVYRAVPKDADQPQVAFSQILPGYHARMVAMSGDHVAVAMPDQKQLVLYGQEGDEVSAYPLDLPASDLAQDPAGGAPVTASTTSNVYWFTGTKLMAMSRNDLTPKWTLESALGPGVQFDHQLVVPIQGGLAVLNEDNGATIRTIGVDRHGYAGPVRLATLGPVLLEQRGDTVAALR